MTSANHRNSDLPVDTLFLERWSPRAFPGEAMPKEHLMTMLEAARWAPSASNHQPWRFVYGIAGTPAFDRLAALLNASNRRWAEKAGALVFVLSRKQTGHEGDAERRPIPTHAFDAGAAWMALALQATMLGYHAHGMAGILHDEIPAALNLDADTRVEAAIAIGAPGRIEDLPEDLQAREKPSQRKALEEIAFEGLLPDRA